MIPLLKMSLRPENQYHASNRMLLLNLFPLKLITLFDSYRLTLSEKKIALLY